MKKKNPKLTSYLNPNFHKKCRRDAVETDYIKGVYNEKGQQVIRPLNDDEKVWLAKYYKKEVAQDFNRKYVSKKEKKRLDLANNARKRCVMSNKGCLVNVKKQQQNNSSYIEISEFKSEVFDSYLTKKTSHVDHETILIDKIEKNVEIRKLRLVKQKSSKQ